MTSNFVQFIELFNALKMSLKIWCQISSTYTTSVPHNYKCLLDEFNLKLLFFLFIINSVSYVKLSDSALIRGPRSSPRISARIRVRANPRGLFQIRGPPSGHKVYLFVKMNYTYR